ncbi:MAG TPA: tetratricopeptide repeat protein [Kofleriaceae bacterium]|nr:tetratricopeptide repeat protein [Kofleriaceae bacterium]
MSDDVRKLMDEAYAHDRKGDERGAIKFYDAAYRAGVPESERRKFLVGYGSTLRNVGRAEDAVAILGEAIAADPDYPAFTAFLALALADAGHPKAALAAMLGCALDVARPDAFGGYERALTEYHQLLLEKSQS